jgi:hypothetical protein
MIKGLNGTEIDLLTRSVIGLTISVHQELGSGLLGASI